ncbi:unnamed protein product [Caenorhabditis angaria]|uniref:G-protein coupled receptors family 1 profile domain-containing protein n=1 Tax=Caenorhabditis angaria TaxID=860376 RepID=A0A9P1N757_9PELO|nr:unnamed protein product [Caenorhabditis angaria]
MWSMAQLNQTFIATEIVFFNIVGVFGNVNFIYLTATRKKLQSKSSILQCFLSAFHIICLLCELPNSFLLFLGLQLRRNVCFPAISIYMFAICVQAFLTLMITIDIVIIVYCPSFYRTTSTPKYITAMLIPPVIYGLMIISLGFWTMDDEMLLFCNPPMSMILIIRRVWTFSSVVINTIVLLLFAILIFVFHRRGKKQKSDTRKIMRRLKIMLLFYIFTWYICLLAADIFVASGITGPTLSFMLSNLVFFVLIVYSQSFYIVLWRSPEYRMAFFETYSFIPWVEQVRQGATWTSKVGTTVSHHSTAYVSQGTSGN